MNFRVNLVVALAAALSFACADKQATIPELEEAMKAPPGLKTIGLYRMDVTPVETASGLQYAFSPIPVGRDGNPNTNPPNTVQVAGAFGAVTTAGPGGCAGVSALTAPVRITNFGIDPLRNVWVEVIDMTGGPLNTACNSTSPALSESQVPASYFNVGMWKYNDLPASTVANGTVAGGTSLPIGGAWGFRYVTTTAYQFYFRVMADDNSPTLNFTDPAGPNNPLSWSSPTVGSTQFQICPADPGFIRGSACPVALTVDQPMTSASPVAPFAFTYTPTTLVQGQKYWWRAINIYPLGRSFYTSDWFSFTYNGVLPTVTNATFLANAPTSLGFQGLLTWTTPLAVTDTWMVLCSPAPCPARAVPPALPPAAYLYDGPVLNDGNPTTVNHYSFITGAPLILATDLLTGTYLDPAATYDWRVYNWDGVATPALGAPHSTGTITVTPVAIAPVITAPGTALAPVAYSLAATIPGPPVSPAPFTVAWTTAAPTTTAVFELLDLNDPLGVPFYASPLPIAGVARGVTGLYDYSVDLRPLVTVMGTGNYLMTVYNADLAGVYGAPHYFNVAP